MQDLVRAAKAKPSTMTYASAGVGTATQLNAVHVPFKGTPEALTEIIVGRVDYYFCPVSAVLPMIANGMLTALAMGSSRRSAALPDLPTTIEAGIPNSDYNFWVGMFAPAKTPHGIVDRLYEETAKTLSAKAVRDSMVTLGAEPMPMRPAEFNSYIRNEIVTNAALVKAAGAAFKESIAPHRLNPVLNPIAATRMRG